MNSELMQQVYDKAKQEYGNEKAAEAFMDGLMEKMATVPEYMTFNTAPGGNLDPRNTFGSTFTKGFGEQTGRAISGSLGSIAVTGIGKIVNAIQGEKLYRNFIKALKEAMQTNRVLKAAPKDKVVNFAHTIFKFAPHVASDINILSSILANAIHGESIDIMTVKTLIEMESRYKDTVSFDHKEWM